MFAGFKSFSFETYSFQTSNTQSLHIGGFGLTGLAGTGVWETQVTLAPPDWWGSELQMWGVTGCQEPRWDMWGGQG